MAWSCGRVDYSRRMFASYHILNNFISKFCMVIWRFIGNERENTSWLCVYNCMRILNKVSLKFSDFYSIVKSNQHEGTIVTVSHALSSRHEYLLTFLVFDLYRFNCMYLTQSSMLMHSLIDMHWSVPVHVRKWFQSIFFFVFHFPCTKSTEHFWNWKVQKCKLRIISTIF